MTTSRSKKRASKTPGKKALGQRFAKPRRNPAYQLHPSQLDPVARRQHVIAALKEYNSGIIENNPQGADNKFSKLLLSPFVFLRGTADLMYRDLAGTDAEQAIVLCMGDVHLENYGVMEAEDGTLLWGLNDFDEAAFAPFSWDVKRGATSTVLAAKDRRFSKKKCAQLARSFAAAYLDAIQQTLDASSAEQAQFTRGRAPKVIDKVLEKTAKLDAETWLREEYLEPRATTPQFRSTDEITPLSKEAAQAKLNLTPEEFKTVVQKGLDTYLASLSGARASRPTVIEVLDLAIKQGSGTGSIGLWRFYALADATRAGRPERLILEVKQQRPSVLKPYVEEWSPFLFASEGSRVAFAENALLPDANPYYGHTRLRSRSYLVRERSPHKKRVKLDKLTKFKTFDQYTRACGAALAYAHGRTDRAFEQRVQALEQRILNSINPDTFARDIGRFAVRMADQVTRDWEDFKQAHSEGSFTFNTAS